MKNHVLQGCVGLLLTAGVASAAWQGPVFVQVTGQRGISGTHQAPGGLPIGTGAAWFDYDNDGDLDLYVTHRTSDNYLWENDGAGNFTNRAASMGVADAGGDGSGVAVADYDNDGDDDLFLANSESNVLFRNEVSTGPPGFTDVTSFAGVENLTDARGTTASWGDYDNDGYVDLYVSHHMNPLALNNRDFTHDAADRLYHNEGDGTFTEVTDMLRGVEDENGNDDVEGFGFVAGFTDFDNDGDLDIHLMNDCPFGPKGNKLWQNDGGSFTEVSALVGADICANAMGIAMGDYNRDGWQDYFFTNIGSAILLRNVGGTLVESTMAAGLYDEEVPETGANRITWGTIFFDYDLDGFQDLVVAGGATGNPIADPQPNILYRNNGDSTFADESLTSWVEDSNATRTVVRGDYDGDGDPDLFWVNHDGPFRLMENVANGPAARWLIVELNGQGAGMTNANGIGARIAVTSNGGTQHFEVHSGSSLGGGDDLAAYFGMGTDVRADEILVAWPSGYYQIVPNQMVNQRIEVDELTYAEQTQKIIDDLDASTVHPNILGQVIPHLESAVVQFEADDPIEAGRELQRASRKMVQSVNTGLIGQRAARQWASIMRAVIEASRLST